MFEYSVKQWIYRQTVSRHYIWQRQEQRNRQRQCVWKTQHVLYFFKIIGNSCHIWWMWVIQWILKKSCGILGEILWKSWRKLVVGGSSSCCSHRCIHSPSLARLQPPPLYFRVLIWNSGCHKYLSDLKVAQISPAQLTLCTGRDKSVQRGRRRRCGPGGGAPGLRK